SGGLFDHGGLGVGEDLVDGRLLRPDRRSRSGRLWRTPLLGTAAPDATVAPTTDTITDAPTGVSGTESDEGAE
ncbi:MAG TPA: hypothetical protein VG795_13735, partial [Acidimicrobiia bacterium]|nr:hypothetical protein [Acidimicrobiia bacterium]